MICDCVCCFLQAEDGIRDLVRSRGLGDVYKRQALAERLEQKAVVKGGLARWEGRRETWWSYNSGDILSLIHI